jgi:hypothetical protein
LGGGCDQALPERRNGLPSPLVLAESSEEFVMRRIAVIAGAAALAVSMPALAEKGGKGGGQAGGQNGRGQAAQVHGGGHGGGKAAQAAPRVQRQAARQAARAERREVRQARPARAERSVRPARVEQRARAEQRAVVRQNERGWARIRGDDRRDDRREMRVERVRIVPDRFDGDRLGRDRYDDGVRYVGYGRSCPPGLAKKGNGCLPPGQARKLYRVGDRFDTGLFGLATVPLAYQAFYPDTSYYRYSYDDSGYIYRVDSRTNMVSGLIPLLGGGFAVGQPMPLGYDVYNVPLQYRDTWYDSDDAYYRYGDNAIYQVDPQTGMIESIVALLAGDLNVGQTLPIGYDAYNLPVDYRDDYYDSDDTLYRYADGNIYQVDAQSRMIEAIVAMLV